MTPDKIQLKENERTELGGGARARYGGANHGDYAILDADRSSSSGERPIVALEREEVRKLAELMGFTVHDRRATHPDVDPGRWFLQPMGGDPVELALTTIDGSGDRRRTTVSATQSKRLSALVADAEDY